MSGAVRDRGPASRQVWAAICSLVVGLVLPAPLPAQLRLASLAQVQAGHLPGDEPGTQRSLYQQLNLAYAARGLELSLRGETFGSSTAGRNYGEVVQRGLRYQRGRFEAGAGNYHAILGEGLLLHAFELPGVLTEDRGWRRPYQLTRDLDGFYLRYQHPRYDLLLLRGGPINSALPPGLEDRRGDALQAASLSWRPRPQLQAGADLLDLGSQVGAGTHLRLRPGPVFGPGSALELYAEYAQRDARPSHWFSLDRDLGRGLYLSASLAAGPWGLSLEYKNYRDLLIADINNPPPLVREHESFLLNRLTHVLLPDDERGTQLEASYTMAGGGSLLFNHTQATRGLEAGGADDEHLRSSFLQVDTPLGEDLHAQAHADLTRSAILQDERRLTLGTRWEWQWHTSRTLSADLQYQDVNRRFGELSLPFENLYLGLGANGAAWSASVVVQRANDTLETGASPTGAGYWTGLNAGLQLAEAHRLDLFAGQRRAGLACTAGTCFEVLGFSGVELRLVNQLF